MTRAAQGQARMANESYRLSIETTRKWHALAERRRAYFVELYSSGRWRRYYSEEAFRAHLRNVMQGVDIWAKLLESWPETSASAKKA
jgi:uncharacterized repeat protein (TIGR03809 family)